jgi:uncharacterized protein YxjI
MKYFLKQKFFAAGDDFEVFDESGKLVYYFDGKVWAIGSKTIVIDSLTGKETARIRRKLFAIRPTFVVSSNGAKLAKIFKKALSIRKTFVIDVPGPDDITVVGELLEHNYHFYRNNTEIASVTKKWFRGEDSYSIEINNNFDALLILSCVVVIDLVCHPGRDSGFKTSKN